MVGTFETSDRCRRARVGAELGQAEVEHLRVLALGHEDVRGLDVAVDDAALMRGVEGVRDLDRRDRGGSRAAAAGPRSGA